MATMAAGKRELEPRSITARVLAPLALIACGLVLFLLVSETLSGGDDGGRDRSPRQEQKQHKQPPEITGDTYTVLPGDTLSEIAAKAEIPLAKLERRNPDIDPATLSAGQQIKLH
jgi:hypothetical protein